MQLSDDNSPEQAVARLIRITSQFPVVTRQIQQRHDNRSTLEIRDEYDVQDLLHTLLRIDFDDVRAEEFTPSHAGKSSRMDFLLKDYQLDRYLQCQERCPPEKVFLVIGLNGTPSDPDRMFCVRLDDIEYANPYLSRLEQYERLPGKDFWYESGRLM